MDAQHLAAYPLTEPMLPPTRLAREIQQYDPVRIVLKCAAISREMDKRQETLLSFDFASRVGNYQIKKPGFVTHHGLAEVVRWAVRNHPYAGTSEPSAIETMRLANNTNNVEDPFLGMGLLTLMRVAYEQFPYQEQYGFLIPRYLAILTETHPTAPVLQVESAFQTTTGMSIKEFMAVGFAFYAATSGPLVFGRSYLENTKVASLQPLLTAKNIDSFLKQATVDFRTFRELVMKEERDAPGLGRYTFNPLVSKPVLVRPSGEFCIPIPKLLIRRITGGLYHDLIDVFSNPTQNPFQDWFGHAFEEYGGILLREVFQPALVFPETGYGKPSEGRRTPDWTVLDGPVGLAVEFRTSRLPKKLRAVADRDALTERLRSALVDPLLKFPGKISDLLNGKTGLPIRGVTRCIPLIVTVEPWYVEGLVTRLVEEQAKALGQPDFPFQLASIAELEWLLTWAQIEPPGALLEEKLSNPETRYIDLHTFLAQRARSLGMPWPQHVLTRRREEFFGQFHEQNEPMSEHSSHVGG
ncbi:MAG: hypothetical protein HY261_05620 [Chloroflexi bacterium]|nr:hypothetical protein [Chloroflexota bacterium]